MVRNQIDSYNLAHTLTKRRLLVAINALAALSICFFGYDQGLMGGVNNAKDYIDLMEFGYVDETGTPIITDSLLQGGIVSVYYLGALVGCLPGGWLGDKMGRTRAIAVGAAWGMLGASLQSAAQNHNWMIVARFVNGWGTGILNTIIPIYATETSEHESRGMFVSIEFTGNIVGVVIAYWMQYGLSFVDGGNTAFRWRFPIAFQIVFLLVIFCATWFYPESPRWLVKVGRDAEARYILGRLRGTGRDGDDAQRAEAELLDIRAASELEEASSSSNTYWSMFWGIGDGKLHYARRVQLVIWLQIMQEWVGIASVAIYAPTLFRIAGYDTNKSLWLSGVNNILFMFSTLICVFTLDRVGRRITLYWGSIAQGITMILTGVFSRMAEDARNSGEISRAASYGAAAATMLVIYTSVFGATWLTVPWIYPAEIFPLQVRAKGNAWGVVGWSIGNGWLTLLCPVMFSAINEKTLYIFGVANAVSIPMVWALYPESNQRTLEEMDLLFAADSPWVWDAERRFAQLKAEIPDHIHAASAKPRPEHIELAKL